MSSRTALVVTVACLSGGSGKTTAALNLATMLADHGKTLAIDFDPQGNLSQWMGWTNLSESATIAETILPGADRVHITEIIRAPLNEDRQERLWLAPSDYSLSRAMDAIVMEPGRELFLKRALRPILSDYDFLVIDSPPSKGLLTYNSILSADLLVVPTECTQKGVMGALSTLVLLKELEELDFHVPKFLGVLPTREQWAGNNRTKMSRAAVEALTEMMQGIPIFTPVRQSTVVQQTNSMGWSLAESGEEVLAQPYREVIEAVLEAR
ncbi:ParA family protein [Synechococcus sp. Nb3U1]|uniref:ParA family protein n=1 Tax=Synechococcus sp. Nb3U1 TaxID=1914529 RepID=UPI001F263CEB|nr:ParA family protein [Synechococcus sp. Nb3U1]MCF2969759.1 ParA family protein [Synechococcus sp. Nb3U1]